jgi:hypothetical protein
MDLSSVDLVDPRREIHLCTLSCRWTRSATPSGGAGPLVDPAASTAPEPAPAPMGIAPLLRQQIAEYAAAGFPPAYVPHDRTGRSDEGACEDDHDLRPSGDDPHER